MRYADDFVVLAKQMGTETIEFIESRLEGKFQLEINRDKTQVVNLRGVRDIEVEVRPRGAPPSSPPVGH